MNYPNDFETDVFPGSRRLAVARTMAIWSCVAFFLIAVLCGLVIWTAQSLRMEPFIVSINSDTGEWAVISEDNSSAREYTAAHAMQEFAVGNFARRWFTISSIERENDARWCRCDPSDCLRSSGDEGRLPCLICCSAGGELFGRFITDVLADYRARAAAGETWGLDEDSIHIWPISGVTENGGLWRLTAVVESNKTGGTRIEAFVRVARAKDYYPLSMGFYVSDFNAFVIDTGR